MIKSIQEKLPLSLQKSLKTVGLNLKYSFNLLTCIFLVLELLIVIVSLLINTKIFDSGYDRVTMVHEIINEYLKNGYFMINLVSSAVAIGLPTLIDKSFEKSILVLRKRNDVFISKIITGIVLVFLLTFTTFAIFIFIPSVSIKGFVIDKEIWLYFVRLFLQICFIYFISMILWELTENNLSIILVVAIYFIILTNSQNYIEINTFIKMTQKLFPIILQSGKNSMFLHGELYVLVYIILEIIVLRYIYINKDIK